MDDLRRGTKLQNGKYKILETLGQGGFGYTYLAEHCLVKQKVAIKELYIHDTYNRIRRSLGIGYKVIWPDMHHENAIKASFMKEVKTLWKLRQSHIVHVMDVFEENNTIYFVMEYLNGKTLRQILEDSGRPITEDKAVSYVKQVARGLVYLHKKRRYHLDIKPDNIIIDAKGYAYIIDFGACIHIHADGETSFKPCYQFTKHYAAFEVEMQASGNIYAASDVYSLGATLYELLSNWKPADAEDRMNGVEHLKPLPDSVSPELRKIVEKAMRKKAINRYQTMDAFLKQLESLKK